jgi:predicted TIM-barrel fold metal-dependent hydrolase
VGEPTPRAMDVAQAQRAHRSVRWSLKYFPPSLVQHANTLLEEKVLFGSDRTEVRGAVRPQILKDNAARLLGLGG